MTHRGANSHGEVARQIREWLTHQGATFTEADPRTRRAERFGISPQQDDEPIPSVAPDFRVLAPLPFVIEVVSGFSVIGRGLTVQQRDQLLAQRILIGSHFGSSLPVVAAVGSGLAEETGFRVPYADATLFVDELPELGDLRSLVAFDPIVLRILTAGDPGRVLPSEPDDVAERWATAVSVRDLEELRGYPVGSLAATISEEFQRVALADSERRQESGMQARRERSTLWFTSMKRFVVRSIEQCLLDHAGGAFEPFPLDWPGVTGELIPKELRLWVAPNGMRFAIDTQIINNLGPFHPARSRSQTLVKPWIYRAFSSVKVREFVLLLGVYNSPAPPIAAVSTFELAGWIVFPWDFVADELPQAVTHLAELGRE